VLSRICRSTRLHFKPTDSTLIAGLIKQFLKDVDWGEVDYLVIDTPPGTSDEHLSVVQYLSEAQVDGAVIITTPQVVGWACWLRKVGHVE